jgi:hypothetical protein
MAAWPAVAASQGSRDDFSQGNGGPSSHSLGSNVSAWRERRKTGKGPGTSMEQTCSKSTDDVRQSCAICPRRIFDSFRLFVDHTRPSHLTVTLLLRRRTAPGHKEMQCAHTSNCRQELLPGGDGRAVRTWAAHWSCRSQLPNHCLPPPLALAS